MQEIMAADLSYSYIDWRAHEFIQRRCLLLQLVVLRRKKMRLLRVNVFTVENSDITALHFTIIYEQLCRAHVASMREPLGEEHH